MKKQLNVWIDGGLKDALAERAQQEKRSLTDLAEDLFVQDMARYKGEIIEQQALPVMRDIVQSEVRKGIAQLMLELREGILAEVVEQQRQFTRRGDDRIAALVVRAVRDASINRRLVYTLLSKTYGVAFAQDAYENAREKAGQELAARVKPKEQKEPEQQEGE